MNRNDFFALGALAVLLVFGVAIGCCNDNCCQPPAVEQHQHEFEHDEHAPAAPADEHSPAAPAA